MWYVPTGEVNFLSHDTLGTVCEGPKFIHSATASVLSLSDEIEKSLSEPIFLLYSGKPMGMEEGVWMDSSVPSAPLTSR